MEMCRLNLCGLSRWRTVFEDAFDQDAGSRNTSSGNTRRSDAPIRACRNRLTERPCGLGSHETGGVSTAEPLMRADLAFCKDPSVLVLAPDDFLCDEAGCPLDLHDHLFYADTNHLTREATQSMEPHLPITDIGARRCLIKRFNLRDEFRSTGSSSGSAATC